MSEIQRKRTGGDPSPNVGEAHILDDRLLGEFKASVGDPTSLQLEVWRTVGSGGNVLVSSPTGSGKTLAAIMSPLDALVRGGLDRNGITVIHVSPMRAMGQDIHGSISSLCERIGPVPCKMRGARSGRDSRPITVGIRSGDVPQQERRRMLRHPPDILIVTPENLLLMLNSSYREILRTARYIVVDEVHELMGNKRGMLLSLALEYLNRISFETTGAEPVRVGLSATVDERAAARFVAGISASGRIRDISIVRSSDVKELEVAIDGLAAKEEDPEASKDLLLNEVGSIMGTIDGGLIVFRNTRAAAEEMAYSLAMRGHDVAAHHGSLGGDIRRIAQDGLRSGRLKCLISSTSLELGIDIGRVDLALQVSSPGDPVSLMQRIGRAGHRLGARSNGRIYPLDAADMLDSYAVLKASIRGIPKHSGDGYGPPDVLAQFMVGLSLEEGGTRIADVLSLARRAYPFRKIRRSDVEAVADLLSARSPTGTLIMPRLRRSGDDLTPARGARQAFYLNCGTIPYETSYRVADDSTNRTVGTLFRDFAESLYEGDVIMLGSRPLRIVRFSGPAIKVREDRNAAPTVPVWIGDSPPRPHSVAEEIYDLWENGLGQDGVILKGRIRISMENGSKETLELLRARAVEEGWAPARDRITVEMVRETNRVLHIFHLPEGRRVNDLFSRLLAHLLGRRTGSRLDIIASEDGFAISSPVDLREFDPVGMLGSCDQEALSREIALASSFYLSRFSHCASRALLVLSRFAGRETGLRYRRRALDGLLKALDGSKGNDTAPGPMRGLVLLREEALRETYEERLDVGRVGEIVGSLSSGTRKMIFLDRQMPGWIGKDIVGRWWKDGGEKGLEHGVGPETAEYPDGGIPSGTMDGESGILQEVISILRGEDIGMDEEDAAKAFGGADPGDLLEQGRLLSIETVSGRRYMDVSGYGPFTDARSREMNAALVRMLEGASSMRGVLKRLPFISDPLDIVLRAEGIHHDDIRSSIIGRRLVPVRVFGRWMLAGREWARIFNPLSFWAEGGGGASAEAGPGPVVSRSRSATLTEFLDMTPFGIPLEEGIYSGYGIGAFETGRRFIELLQRIGPLGLSSLCRLFRWRAGSIPVGAIDMIGRGHVELSIGWTPGDVWRKPSLEVWFKAADKGLKNGPEQGSKSLKGPPPMDRSPLWVTAGDPYLALSGAGTIRHLDPKVKGARGQTLVLLSDGKPSGKAVISLSGNLIRVHELEVGEHALLGAGSGSLVRSLERLDALGYDCLTLESVGGAPSGEGDNPATRAFLEKGFVRSTTEGSSFLSRGAVLRCDIDMETVILSMLFHQGLIEGHHLSHPLEVIQRLGGISDRWEIASRLGSGRYGEIRSGSYADMAEDTVDRFEDIVDSVKGDRPCIPAGPAPVRATTRTIDLSDLKDLKRKYGLLTGMLDQVLPVASYGGLLARFPPTERTPRHKVRRNRLLSSVEASHGMIDPHPDMDDDPSGMKALLKGGLVSLDGWGRYSVIHRPSEADKGKRRVAKGVLLRAWILFIARSLGMFTFRGLMNCSPRLGPPGRVRIMLKDLCASHLDRFIIADPMPGTLYCLKDLDFDAVEKVKKKEGISSVISPKDRMARVLSSLSIGGRKVPRGHLFLSGASLLASVRFRSASASGASASRRLVISSFHCAPGMDRRSVLRSIRKSMYSLGYDVMTREEMDAYREIDLTAKG
ncbi:MAG: DEAD/DEAH box helicase [Candidatus Thermoplasmatota archaeon]|nr:DEAD/DEAH box helicase [Candidatus Thermoplasmatota archaeon]